MPKAAPQPTLIDCLTPAALYGAFAEQVLAEGRDAVERGRVSRPLLRPARAEAVVVGADRRSHRARLLLADDDVAWSCSCGANRCEHAAALGLLLVGEARCAGLRGIHRGPAGGAGGLGGHGCGDAARAGEGAGGCSLCLLKATPKVTFSS